MNHTEAVAKVMRLITDGEWGDMHGGDIVFRGGNFVIAPEDYKAAGDIPIITVGDYARQFGLSLVQTKIINKKCRKLEQEGLL